jgi:hypothetical protein
LANLLLALRLPTICVVFFFLFFFQSTIDLSHSFATSSQLQSRLILFQFAPEKEREREREREGESSPAMADQEAEEQEQERDELERQIRTSKALQAMEKELQLSTAAVMPVLMKLLKVWQINCPDFLSNFFSAREMRFVWCSVSECAAVEFACRHLTGSGSTSRTRITVSWPT